MIENKRSYVQKEMKPESRPEPLYTVTSNRLFSILEVYSAKVARVWLYLTRVHMFFLQWQHGDTKDSEKSKKNFWWFGQSKSVTQSPAC